MHPRHAQYYIRRVRIAKTDALFRMLKDQNVPYHPEVGYTEETASTFVLEFPVAAPKGSIFKDDISAIDQLEHWKKVKQNYKIGGCIGSDYHAIYTFKTRTTKKHKSNMLLVSKRIKQKNRRAA